MFLPVKTGEEIIGDFTSDDPALTFAKEDVEFVIGSKWEQVYARMIDGEYYVLPAKWYVAKKKWVPYKVKDWKETPLSKKCNGCHTTGFDPATLLFSEFGIGCEACHGSGSAHVQNRRMSGDNWCVVCHQGDDPPQKDIVKSVSAAVCGQCHNRGANVKSDLAAEGEFNFPLNVKPGENLDKKFVPLTPDQDKKGKFWWGQGVSKNRHQEFADWNNSKHSKALILLHDKYNPEGDRGILTQACLECHSTDYRHSDEDEKPTLETAKYGVTCVACHDPHGLDKRSVMWRGAQRCGGCHIDSMSHSSSASDQPHSPCPPGLVGCPDCHMPRIVKTGGFFSLRSHAFKVIRPMDGMEKGMPNSCKNGDCHADRSLEWLTNAYNRHYHF